MRASDLQQWQWIIISLIVGAGVGYVVQRAGDDLNETYGDQLVSQQRFEEALLKIEHGRPCFTDIAVHKQFVPDRKGGRKAVYVVAGRYYNGHPRQVIGKVEIDWPGAFFIADIPYKPATDIGRFGNPQAAARFAAIAQPTVVDYLDQLGEARGVRFTYAWWREMGLKSWLACSFLGIGVVWPIVINLMVYGSIRRPNEEKGTDLSNVKTQEATPAADSVTEDDLAHLAELEAQMEKEMADSDPTLAPSPVAPQRPAQILETAPLQPSADAVQTAEQKAFAAKANDYYPTELRIPRAPDKDLK